MVSGGYYFQGFSYFVNFLTSDKENTTMKQDNRLKRGFFTRDVLDVAPSLPGKMLCVKGSDGLICRHMITEVEAYRGEDDEACHVSRGRTPRNRIMYERGGHIYMYLVYGLHWMLNIVTGEEEVPQAVLIRGISGFDGPGKLTRNLKIDGSYYGLDITVSGNIWLEDHGLEVDLARGKRIGIDYAGLYWRDIEWRYYAR